MSNRQSGPAACDVGRVRCARLARPLVGACAGGTLLLAGICSGSAGARQESGLGRALSSCGVSEGALAAACVDGAGVHAALGALRFSPAVSLLLDATVALSEAERALLDAREVSDPQEADGAAVIAAAEANVQAARAARENAAQELFDELIAPMSSHQQAALRAWREAPPGLPPELRVVAWEAGQAERVLAALLDERLSIVQNAPMSAESAAVLVVARARPEVVAARACRAGAMAEVTAAYRAELDSE